MNLEILQHIVKNGNGEQIAKEIRFIPKKTMKNQHKVDKSLAEELDFYDVREYLNSSQFKTAFLREGYEYRVNMLFSFGWRGVFNGFKGANDFHIYLDKIDDYEVNIRDVYAFQIVEVKQSDIRR